MPVHHFSNGTNRYSSAEAAYGTRLKSSWPKSAYEFTLADIPCLLYIFEQCGGDLHS